jgi:hypothetical protein
LSAFACLFAWLSGASSLLPAAVAALGSLDGQHLVSIAERSGQLAVVFHHENRALAPAHSHTPLAKLLTSVAQSSGATQDHVFTFAPVDAARATAPAVVPVALSAEVPPPAEISVLLPFPAPAATPSLAPRPPSACAFALTCLRSTTLLV